MSRRSFVAVAVLLLSSCGADSKGQGDSGQVDYDLDGHDAQSDCDDTDPTVNTAADEVCDGKDNDCDGIIDGVSALDALTWFFDQDGDGFGSDTISRVACTQPVSDQASASGAAFVIGGGDCDDSDALIFPGAVEECDEVDNDCDDEIDEGVKSTFYPDRDGDGYGVASAPAEACSAPTGYSNEKGDCDDSNPLVNQGATELCNGVDDDCDEQIDEDDAADAPSWSVDRDGDGFGDFSDLKVQCEQPIGYVYMGAASEEDCNDLSVDQAPDRLEVCDGLDNDCNLTVDDDSAEDALEFFEDADGDGFVNGLNIYVKACENPDDTLYKLFDPGDLTDCDDGLAAVNPAAPELCSTPYDDDCDGVINEGDASDADTFYVDADGDGYGWASSTVLACVVPSGFVGNQDDCDDTSSEASPAHSSADELCDGLDNDCDGMVDGTADGTADGQAAADASEWFYDYDGDGYGSSTRSTLACGVPSGHVGDNTDCDDSDASVNPSATEYCNGVDDDCDGDTDPFDSVDAVLFYSDLDGDGFGDAAGAQWACAQPSGTVTDKSDCNDRNAAIFPGAAEVCNGEDDDCDSSTADPTTRYYFDEDEDGYGDPATYEDSCSEPTTGGTWVDNDTDCGPSTALMSPDGSEVCDGLDNDCNGLEDDVGEYCLESLSLSEVATYEDNTSAPDECALVTVMTGKIAPDRADDGELCGCAFILDLEIDTEVFTPDDPKCSYIEEDLYRYEQVGIVDDLSAVDADSCGTVQVRGLRDGSWRDIDMSASLSSFNSGHCESIAWETTDVTLPAAATDTGVDSGADPGTPATDLSLDITIQVSGVEK